MNWFTSKCQVIKSKIRTLRRLWAFAESLEVFNERVEKLELDTDMIVRNLSDVDKLMNLVSTKELELSEMSLFKANDEAEQDMTLEEIESQISELTSLKVSFNTSPAVGSRMVRAKNYQLTEINKQLETLMRRRAKWVR